MLDQANMATTNLLDNRVAWFSNFSFSFLEEGDFQLSIFALIQEMVDFIKQAKELISEYFLKL